MPVCHIVLVGMAGKGRVSVSLRRDPLLDSTATTMLTILECLRNFSVDKFLRGGLSELSSD